MYLIIGVFLIGIGLIMLIDPQMFFEITESWKVDRDSQPSDWYILNTRIGGGIMLIVGCGGIAVQLFLQ